MISEIIGNFKEIPESTTHNEHKAGDTIEMVEPPGDDQHVDEPKDRLGTSSKYLYYHNLTIQKPEFKITSNHLPFLETLVFLPKKSKIFSSLFIPLH